MKETITEPNPVRFRIGYFGIVYYEGYKLLKE